MPLAFAFFLDCALTYACRYSFPSSFLLVVLWLLRLSFVMCEVQFSGIHLKKSGARDTAFLVFASFVGVKSKFP